MLVEDALDSGAGSRNRTHDQRFTKPLLYQLSYAGISVDCSVRANERAAWRAELLDDLQVGRPLARRF